MKCPSCGAQSGDGATECPSCGLVFAKWRARQEKEKREAVEALAVLAAPAPALTANSWAVRGVAIACVAAWILFLSYFVRRHPAKRGPVLGADTGEFVEMRDPKTGDMRRMPIRRMAGVPTAPTASEPQSPASGR